MTYKVFLSYAWKNSAERHALSTEITRIENVEVLVDKEQIIPGQPVHQCISEMIDKANCVVILLTEEGLQSREVLDEVSRAHDRGKDIIPVVAKDTGISSLPWHLRDINYITYDERDFDATIDAVVTTIDK